MQTITKKWAEKISQPFRVGVDFIDIIGITITPIRFIKIQLKYSEVKKKLLGHMNSEKMYVQFP